MARPDDLCEFQNPPLNEVVIGIQFVPAPGYQAIRAGEVWALYREHFPQVQELPPLPPVFETFGRPQPPQMNFGIVTGAIHNRFWFLSESGDELLQFQADRLLHNWRKVGDQTNDYPRFETIIAKFEDESARLERYFKDLGSHALIIQQCEISYVNHIRDARNERIRPSDWLSFLMVPGDAPDDFSCSFSRTITSGDGRPQGRLYCESGAAVDQAGKPMIQLTLTARGIPDQPELRSALDFLHRGREMIVRSFADVTTDSAHKAWERTC